MEKKLNARATPAQPDKAEVMLPTINKFKINPVGGKDIELEGNKWFCHAHEVEAYRAAVKPYLAALLPQRDGSGVVEAEQPDERTAFEALAKEMGYTVTRRENGVYDSSHTGLMRTTWNAALAYESEATKRESVKANHYEMAIAKDFPDGTSLYVKENGVGGHTYYTDEIGCGVMVWDTALVSEQALLAAIEHNKGNLIEDQYPECSGNPNSCPENEGYGCCKEGAKS